MTEETTTGPASAGPPPTPELGKISQARKDGSDAIGHFLEQLQEHGITLCTFHADDGAWYPAELNIQRLLADYFGIDLEKAEAERQAVLAYLRSRS